MSPPSLSEEIRSRRRERGLTQSQLAAAAAIPLRTYLRVEAGDRSVQIGTYARAALAIGCRLTLAPVGRPTLDEVDAIFAEDAD